MKEKSRLPLLLVGAAVLLGANGVGLLAESVVNTPPSDRPLVAGTITVLSLFFTGVAIVTDRLLKRQERRIKEESNLREAEHLRRLREL